MMPWNKNPGEPIPTQTTVAAMNLFYSYKMQHSNFVPPVAEIRIEKEDLDTNNVDVHIYTSHQGTNLHMRSLRPEEHTDIQTYLNSQPLVRGRYANKKTIDAETTRLRISTLSSRFDPACTDGCYMHGGFSVTDNDTEEFLGMANSGFSGTKGTPEIAYLFRPDAWSNKPANIVAEYQIPDNKRLHKGYSGAATAVVSSLVQYTQLLKKENYRIKGEEITGMRATAMVDNPGSWKALAKVGFEPYDLDAKDEWGPEIRYQLGLKF